MQKVEDVDLRGNAGLKRQFDRVEHGLLVVLQHERQDLGHLSIAARAAQELALQQLEGLGQLNVVNPDTVIRGSRIWDGDWRKERAGAHGIDAGDVLEDFYRKRSMLKLNVLPEDIAEAVYFFASDASVKSTADIINVDAANAQAFILAKIRAEKGGAVDPLEAYRQSGWRTRKAHERRAVGTGAGIV